MSSVLTREKWTYSTAILLLILHGPGTWSLTSREISWRLGAGFYGSNALWILAAFSVS
jgi:hypothetical protein